MLVAAALGASAGPSPDVEAAVLHVPDDYVTLRGALSAASPGDTVLVAPGTYTEPTESTPYGPSMVVMASGVVLRSAEGPDVTVLDARGEGRTVYIGNADPSTRVEGFTVTGGVALGGALYEDHGGGIFCYHSSPTLIECAVVGNEAFIGGGMAGDHPSAPVMVGCVFEGNLAIGGEGGGLAFLGSSAAQIVDCTFAANEAARGGGVQCYVSTPELTDCRFLRNRATEAGGAVHIYLGSPTLDGCSFWENTAPAGGAIHARNGSLLGITGCTIARSSSTDMVGAGAVSLDGSFAAIGNTIVAFSESGGAVHCKGEAAGAEITCSDLFGNADGDWTGCILDQYGDGNMAEDPLFCDLMSGDLSLDDASPCAEENSPVCGWVGALPVGCSVSGIPAAPPDRGPALDPLLELCLLENPVQGPLRFLLRLSDASEVQIQVLDVTGRAIGEVASGSFRAGGEILSWSPRSLAGERLPRGIYYLCVRSRAGVVARSFVLID